MGLFDMFRSQKSAAAAQSRSQGDAAAWVEVAGKLSSTLWQLMQRDPKMLMTQYARVVLDGQWNVGIAADYRDPNKVLGANDVAFVFLREDMSALKLWIQEMQSNPTPMFQQIATEEFAKKLTRTLASRVEIAG